MEEPIALSEFIRNGNAWAQKLEFTDLQAAGGILSDVGGFKRREEIHLNDF